MEKIVMIASIDDIVEDDNGCKVYANCPEQGKNYNLEYDEKGNLIKVTECRE